MSKDYKIYKKGTKAPRKHFKKNLVPALGSTGPWEWAAATIKGRQYLASGCTADQLHT